MIYECEYCTDDAEFESLIEAIENGWTATQTGFRCPTCPYGSDTERLNWLESRMKAVQGPDEVVEIEDAVYAGKSLRQAIDDIRGNGK